MRTKDEQRYEYDQILSYETLIFSNPEKTCANLNIPLFKLKAVIPKSTDSPRKLIFNNVEYSRPENLVIKYFESLGEYAFWDEGACFELIQKAVKIETFVSFFISKNLMRDSEYINWGKKYQEIWYEADDLLYGNWVAEKYSHMRGKNNFYIDESNAHEFSILLNDLYRKNLFSQNKKHITRHFDFLLQEAADLAFSVRGPNHWKVLSESDLDATNKIMDNINWVQFYKDDIRSQGNLNTRADLTVINPHDGSFKQVEVKVDDNLTDFQKNIICYVVHYKLNYSIFKLIEIDKKFSDNKNLFD